MDTSPSARIADEIAARIATGELAPGDRVPSTRQLITTHGIAMATATKVLTTLRDRGLVRALPGVGTVVASALPDRANPDLSEVIAAAIKVADREGLTALSMRRLAGEVSLPTMSLYRYVADKEELLLVMMDTVFAANPPPSLSPGVHGWRACLEAGARLQWTMYQRQPWLAQAISFTRPLLAPNAMAHTEYSMRALATLDPDSQFRAAVMLANHVRGTAVNIEAEIQARQDTGITEEEWLGSQEQRFTEILSRGTLPMMSSYLAQPTVEFDLGILFDFGLQRLLDGLAPLMEK
ncbi:TetR/AcrR family transcriptional regulator C-terminal domain-containing protein [Winogradskya humida]|uniref:GntR family transcriptional regulator n=1 Tax=Winogradskya humida TaxID=113566 RepID=A0ABQ3ZUU5_9ACTN|nr:GntR family transcriptional regulator [Actinoplanes humidus]GIE22366.1 GntR family transcriptional regulator [Actinoplanes humidus]